MDACLGALLRLCQDAVGADIVRHVIADTLTVSTITVRVHDGIAYVLDHDGLETSQMASALTHMRHGETYDCDALVAPNPPQCPIIVAAAPNVNGGVWRLCARKQ